MPPPRPFGHGEMARLPRERITDAVRPRQWAYLQSASAAVVLVGVLESILTYTSVTKSLGRIGTYERFLSTGCFWDGAVVAGLVLVLSFLLHCLLNARNMYGIQVLKLFLVVTVLSCAGLFITTLVKVFAWQTMLGVQSTSCSFLPPAGRQLPPTQVGTCYDFCVLKKPPPASCCCCSSFSLTSDNVTVFTGVSSCKDIEGPALAFFALSVLLCGGLTLLCCLLLVVELSLVRGWCGPRLSQVLAGACSDPTERTALVGDRLPGYTVTPSAPPMVRYGDSATVASAAMTAPQTQATLTLDQGPPPAYQDTWGRQHPARAASPSPRLHRAAPSLLA